jgi:NADH:ubiquinone oxidoreductase subunit 5 (subunit L)/multisubunit Na+/H+ antiporter MnhA subunit
MFIFILLLYNIFLTLDITILNSQIYVLDNTMIYIFNYKINFIEFLCLILLVPASIKSAQFGAHIWLPDSMEAPVPASALIHSATLVSAGVFLLLRFSVFFEYTYVCNLLIPFLGALTAFTGSFLACFQSDIKKILAYSTISHCGFLFYLVNTSVIEFTLFYLFAHGFFKAASFMCIGNVLRFSKGYQDFRRMGGF